MQHDLGDPHASDFPILHDSFGHSSHKPVGNNRSDYQFTFPPSSRSRVDQNSLMHYYPSLTPATECSSPIDRKVGVRCMSTSDHSLLLTYSGEVYGWGCNGSGQVLYDGPQSIKSPIKLPLTNIVSISAGICYSLALSSDGKLYGWGFNGDWQITVSEKETLPVSLIDIPYNIKEVHGGRRCSFALTLEGQVVKWGDGKSFELIEDLINIIIISVDCNSLLAIKITNHLLYFDLSKCVSLQLPSVHSPITSRCVSLDVDLFFIDINGNVMKYAVESAETPFPGEPIKVYGLINIVFISGRNGIYAAVDNNGKVFLWGDLSRISNFYRNSNEPICVETLTNIEGISVSRNFLFAYNKNNVWAWGRNYQGQLGTGDLIDRPQPVKLFGSEILGNFHYPKQTLNRMFSGLVKLVYWEYLNYLQKLFGNHPYVKARFYTKCGISKRVAQFAQEVFNDHPILFIMSLKDPQDLNLNGNICDLQLQLSSNYYGRKVINTRIKKLDVYYDEVDYDPDLLSFFPNVEVVKLCGSSLFTKSVTLNLAHLSSLKCLELDYRIDIAQLPTSLVRLVLENGRKLVDLSYLSSLKELVLSSEFSKTVLKGQLHLPQSIVRMEVLLWAPVCVQIQLPNLKELVIHWNVPTNITEQNFPSLKFIQLNQVSQRSLSDSPLSPTKLINQGLIKSVKLIMNEYLVELSSFPWWSEYSAERELIDIFHEYLDENYLFNQVF
ncbi:hypothetical protein P9112_000656 [Eukaryota sp. TZLM1-RC]